MEETNTQGTILIVEDGPDLRTLLADVFEGEGYKVLIAANGKEALRILDFQVVDVILTDFRMPIMGGLILGQTVKAETRLKHIPVILLSATPMADTWEKFGVFQDYLWKPAPLEDIIEAVRLAQTHGNGGAQRLAS
ncbi:MAG TPA: response regulator [Noviherbaspirillum sp.]